jgi:hypothetical protein
MLIGGVALSVGAVAMLARRLGEAGHAELAMRIGLAVDSNSDQVLLSRGDERLVVAVLERCPEGLRGLRDALRGRVTGNDKPVVGLPDARAYARRKVNAPPSL